jgi:hypothetical protein
MGKFAIAMILWTAAGAEAALAQVTPRGDGDPVAVTCMKGIKKTGSSFVSPPVCKTNAEWAQLYQQRMDPRNIGNPAACIGPEGAVDQGGAPTCR